MSIIMNDEYERIYDNYQINDITDLIIEPILV